MRHLNHHFAVLRGRGDVRREPDESGDYERRASFTAQKKIRDRSRITQVEERIDIARKFAE